MIEQHSLPQFCIRHDRLTGAILCKEKMIAIIYKDAQYSTLCHDLGLSSSLQAIRVPFSIALGLHTHSELLQATLLVFYWIDCL